MSKKYRLLIHSAQQVVQVVDEGSRVLTGDRMKQIAILSQKENDGLSILVDGSGKIEKLGYDSEINKFVNLEDVENCIDATGKSIIPGLVDGHTHSVWVGDRVNEFAMKLAGATYMEVHEAGGGIMFTVDRVREASEDELYINFKKFTKRMLEAGTTLAECKSGYGLDAETEIKMLKVIERGKQELPMDISSTYCGAHAVPKGCTATEATLDILDVQIPKLKALIEAGKLTVDNIDVFCEKGVYDVAQTRQILEKGVDIGLAINFHGEELHRLNSAEMGAELKSRAISHLEEISPDGITAMAEAGSIGVVLPTTAYILRLTPPPVRDMIAGGMAVALGSDFNPNAHCMAMPVVMHLACVILRMSMPEVLVAATINAAASLGRADTQGSLEVGKLCDMVIIDAPRWEHLIYQLGSYHHLITHVIKEGKIVHHMNTL